MKTIVLPVLLSLVLAHSAASEEPDLEGRAALLSAIESALDDGQLEAAESGMAEFRLRYPASSRVRGWPNGNEVVYLYGVTSRLAQEYDRRRDFGKVVRVFTDELTGLSQEVPHYSWRFVGLSVPYQLETGDRSREELLANLDKHKTLFAEMGERVEHPGRKDLFAGLEARMQATSHHLDLLGEPAPDFTFVTAFNAEPSLTLAQLAGDVVLIDFWATWCAPCMAAWPSLAALRERYRDRGFEILSITSLQGSVGAEKGLTPEREIELTREFIERHGVDWPVLFSDRDVNDPEYGAVSLPSYALLDRQSRVDRVFVGELTTLAEAAIERLVATPKP